jgi:ubiquinone/menaquinone biosynthesis C-methylase UbiE
MVNEDGESYGDQVDQQQVWDKIAEPWKRFRVHSLQEVREFLVDKSGKILDLGCGSGRNFQFSKGVIYGVDFSASMLKHAEACAKEAEKDGVNVVLFKADADDLPFEDEFFDAGMMIAVLHCIQGKEKRRRVLKELYRVLKPGAECLMSVWDKEQNNNRFRDFGKEGYYDWKYQDKAYKRYAYLFDKEELKELLEECGFSVTKVLSKTLDLGKFSKKNLIISFKRP